MSTHDGSVDHHEFVIGIACQRLENSQENAALRPSAEALMHDLRGAETRRQITPRDSCSISVKQRIDEQPVVRCIATYMAFSAGQFAKVAFAPGLARDYSMANVPDTAELEFHVRRIPGGLASSHVWEHLREGDRVRVEGPFGDCWLREEHAGPIVCVAGGSGLAPVKSIVETALRRGMTNPIHLYFGVRAEREERGQSGIGGGRGGGGHRSGESEIGDNRTLWDL